MLEIIDLTPEDQLILDPTGRCRETLKRYERESFNPQSSLTTRLTSSQWLEQLHLVNAQMQSQARKHAIYFDWNYNFDSKYGPQGGTFHIDKLKDIYRESYSNVGTPKLHAIIRGRDYLLRRIKAITQKVGIASPTPGTVVDTAAALPMGGHKGGYYQECVGARQWRHLFPVLPGERRQRGKDRCINQDAVTNVRYIESELNGIRYWLRSNLPEYFGSWLNPKQVVRPTLTKIIDANMYVAETDYDGMDLHFSRVLAEEIFLPICEALLPPGNYLHLAQYVTAAFYQPIYFGEELWTGEHNLLSGISITNDVETIVSVCQDIGCTLCIGVAPEDSLQLHIGDDQVKAFRSQRHRDAYFDAFAEESDLIRLPLSLQKCEKRRGVAGYCRTLYYPGGKRDAEGFLIGAYPTVLTLNSVVNPEFLSRTSGIAACATYQRLDNAVGSPDWINLVHMVARFSDLKKREFSDDDCHHLSARDWWYRVYGEVWEPSCSPSYRLVNGIYQS